MSSVLQGLQPKLVWKWFDKICSIPHPSYHDHNLVDFIVEWSKKHNYFVDQDEVGNVLLRKPATSGLEERPIICLQAHSDMVPQADTNKQHDFLIDPITPVIKDGMLYADNTTLGADNGIGLATILAIFEDNNLVHGPLEAIITRQEEVGMDGAKGLKSNWLSADYMINLDTEEWGYLYLGCAGGIDLTFSKKYEFKDLKDGSHVFKISLEGFRGGHSGCDIHTNRENAIKYLNTLLHKVYQKVKFNFCTYFSGDARNAIPRDAYCVVAVTAHNYEKFKNYFAEDIPKITSIFSHAEVNGKIILEELNSRDFKRLSCYDMPALLDFLAIVPNGVQRFSDVFEGVVETSLSAGMIRINPETGFSYQMLARSTHDESLQTLTSKLEGLARLANLDFKASNFYSGWLPEKSSFSDFICNKYSEHAGRSIQVQVIHAGLECGIIKGHYPNMKIVSIGPNIYNPHTPKEHCDIESVEKFYNLLIDILASFKG